MVTKSVDVKMDSTLNALSTIFMQSFLYGLLNFLNVIHINVLLNLINNEARSRRRRKSC